MSSRHAVAFSSLTRPLPEDADHALFAGILQRVLPPADSCVAAVELIATFQGLAGVAAADEVASLAPRRMIGDAVNRVVHISPHASGSLRRSGDRLERLRRRRLSGRAPGLIAHFRRGPEGLEAPEAP